MEQLEAIKKVLPLLIADKAVKAVFLKGSIARGENDDFSDIDLYCLVEKEELDDFLNRRMSYLKEYRPLIFTRDVNHVGPQLVGVFDNGIHIDLYTLTSNSMNTTDQIKVLYDPEKLLYEYKQEPLSISEKLLVDYFDDIAFLMLEFEGAYSRGDLMYASRLGGHIYSYLSIILRYMYDADNAQIGLKGLDKVLSKDKLNKLIGAMDLLGPSYLPEGVKVLIEIINEVLEELPKEITKKVNKLFLNTMINKIEKLK
jgi:predicted nucleotidyltransferase